MAHERHCFHSVFLCGAALGAAVMRFAMPKNSGEAEARLLSEKTAELKSELEAERREAKSAREQVARLEERLGQHKADREQLEAKSRESFQNLATKIFDAQAEKFNTASKEKLDVLLSRAKALDDFQKKVDENVKEQFSLKNEISRFVLNNDKMIEGTQPHQRAEGQFQKRKGWANWCLKTSSKLGLPVMKTIFCSAELGLKPKTAAQKPRWW